MFKCNCGEEFNPRKKLIKIVIRGGKTTSIYEFECNYCGDVYTENEKEGTWTT